MSRPFTFLASLTLLTATIVRGADPSPVYHKTVLPTGSLFVSSDWKPRDRHADLLVFFHGHAPVVCSNLTRSGKSAALLVINFNGLSAAYAKPFTDTNLFGQAITNAFKELARQTGQELVPGKLAVASFSAGYGAVREILKDRAWRERITDLVLADSLYAGYVERDGKNIVNPEHVRDFIGFAQRAASREATMIVTHSEQVPTGYASTTETADELIEALGGARMIADGPSLPGPKLKSVSAVRGFRMFGYHGDAPQDHMNHLRNVGEALRHTSLPDRKVGH